MPRASEALEGIGAQIGLGKLEFDADGACGLIIGETMEIFFHGAPDDEVIRLTGVLGDMDEDRPGLALRLLELNAGDGANGCSAFAVDPDTGEILLVTELAVARMSPEEIFAAVEAFVTRIAYWIENLPRIDIDDDGDGVPEALALDAVILRG